MASLNDIETQLDAIIEILSIEQENNTMLHQILKAMNIEVGGNNGKSE